MGGQEQGHCHPHTSRRAYGPPGEAQGAPSDQHRNGLGSQLPCPTPHQAGYTSSRTFRNLKALPFHGAIPALPTTPTLHLPPEAQG